MHPPSEQLVRDYLNRLSVAARSRLGPREREQLLDRTRARIEASVGGMSGATTLQVRRVLADLGDPVAIVECEWASYAARADGAQLPTRYARTQASPAKVISLQADQAVTGGGAAAPVVAASTTAGSNAVIMVRTDTVSGQVAAAGSWRQDGEPAPLSPDGSSAPSRTGPVAAARSRGEVPPRDQGEPSRGSGQAGSSDSDPSSTAPVPSATSQAPAPDVPAPPPPRAVPPQERIVAAEPGPGEPEQAERDESEPGPAEVPIYTPEMFSLSVGRVTRAREMVGRALPAAAQALARQVFRVGHSLIALAIRDKLETLAILLLGLGGAVYPPVWFVGAVLALISPKWDLRDKLLGLVLPAILVVFGAVMVVALGGVRSTLTQYGVEGWLAAGRLSRVGAVIGAGYLLRRVYRGKRAQKPPPWSRTQGGRRSPGTRQPPR